MVLFCPALHLTKAFPPIPALLFASPVASPPSWLSFYSLIFSIRPVCPSPFLLPLTLTPLAPIPLCPSEPASKAHFLDFTPHSQEHIVCVSCVKSCAAFSVFLSDKSGTEKKPKALRELGTFQINKCLKLSC